MHTDSNTHTEEKPKLKTILPALWVQLGSISKKNQVLHQVSGIMGPSPPRYPAHLAVRGFSFFILCMYVYISEHYNLLYYLYIEMLEGKIKQDKYCHLAIAV